MHNSNLSREEERNLRSQNTMNIPYVLTNFICLTQNSCAYFLPAFVYHLSGRGMGK
uniref:Uncharacterized protein n=1 Tax=Rhizophora mucronata TaxID=61149 RepID=A0A2P2NKD3_RHIMU